MATTILQAPARHPHVARRRVFLSEQDYDYQLQQGLYTTQRGENLAIPVDKLSNSKVYKGDTLWVNDKVHGVHRPGVRFVPHGTMWQKKLLSWLSANVNKQIPYWYYLATLGHDIHTSTWGDLYAKHWHRSWANPFNPDNVDGPLDPNNMGVHPSKQGFVENCGWLSGGRVTDVFVNVQVGAMVDHAGSGQAAEFNDFNEHEVGTSSTAENEAHTALQATSGIALEGGSQVDNGGDPPTMTSVATITADASETWEEHGIFSTTIDSLLDRSLTGGQSVTSSDQVQYTYTLTVNPETS